MRPLLFASWLTAQTKSVFGTQLFSDLSSLGVSAQVNLATVVGNNDFSNFAIGNVRAPTVIIVEEVDVRGEGGNGRQRFEVGGRKSSARSAKSSTRAASGSSRSSSRSSA